MIASDQIWGQPFDSTIPVSQIKPTALSLTMQRHHASMSSLAKKGGCHSPRQNVVQHLHIHKCTAASSLRSRQCQADDRADADRTCTTRLTALSTAQPTSVLSSADVLSPVTDAASPDDIMPSADLAVQSRKQIRDGSGRLMLKNLTFRELEDWCKSEGERPQRAKQLWRWMYHDKFWARSIEGTADLQDGFSEAYRCRTRDIATIDGGLKLEDIQTATDGTRKLLFKLTEGSGKGSVIESVLIPVMREGGWKPRMTLCVSSQVGCAMNCQFCLTGRMGLAANLSTAQIVEQVVEARRIVAKESQGATLTNIVFMGMGEPLHNLEAVLPALEIVTHPLGLHFGVPRVTVSTVGLVPEIQELCAKSKVQLAISLHATTDEVRDWIAPVNRRWPLKTLLATLEAIFPRGGQRSVFVEFVMLQGINDSLEDAHRLVQLLQPIQCKVNLIAFNTHEGSRFQPSGREAMLSFRSILIQHGMVCTIRESRGDDEMAACGQLGVDKDRTAPMLRVPVQFEKALIAH